MPTVGCRVTIDTAIFDKIRESIGVVLTEEQSDEATTVWVGGIPDNVVAGDDPRQWADAVRALFEGRGAVCGVTVRKKTGGGSGLNRSWALVTFESAAGCAAALRSPVIAPGPAGSPVPVVLSVEPTAAPAELVNSSGGSGGGGGGGDGTGMSAAIRATHEHAVGAKVGVVQAEVKSARIDADAALQNAARVVRRGSVTHNLG